MLNDRSSALSLLRTRRSAKPRDLIGPAPSPAEFEQIIAIAARTPDHGGLAPWRFVAVAEDQRDDLAKLLLTALAEDNPEAGPAHRDKETSFAHFSGQLVVVVSAPVHDHKIPVCEQELSCGAATMNLLLAAHALGLGSALTTITTVFGDELRSLLALPDHVRPLGVVPLGWPAKQLGPPRRTPVAEKTFRDRYGTSWS